LGEYYGGSIGLLHASFEASLSLLGRQQLMTSHLAAGGTEAIDKYQLIAITGNHHFAIEKCVCIYIYVSISGWWYTYPSEKYEFVSWDDDIPNIWKIKSMFQTNNHKIIVDMCIQ